MIQPGTQQKQRYFRSLSELENTPEFEQFLQREFPQAASEFPDGVSRRQWLKLMGASLALGGVTGCRFQKEEIAAFVVRPEGRLPGVPIKFATNFEWAGRAVHLLVSNIDGRPIKIDGNPQHPMYASVALDDLKDGKEVKFASAGTDVFSQAAILSLYDPDRLGSVVQIDGKPVGKRQEKSWADFESAASKSLSILEGGKGKGLAILMEPTRSPSLQRLMAEVKSKLPEAVFVVHSAIDRSEQSKALKASGIAGDVMYRLDVAKVIAAFDADLLGNDPAAVYHSRQFALGRTPTGGSAMNRLYCVESAYSVTGGAADFRLAIRSSSIGSLVAKLEAAVDAALGGNAKAVDEEPAYSSLDLGAKVDRVISQIASDLVANRGESLVAVGSHQPAPVQQAAMRLNAKLGNIGKTVQALEAAGFLKDVASITLSEFATKATAGDFSVAWILGGNPVFGAPASIKIKESLEKIATKFHCTDYDDETSQHCTWLLPVAHPLESWGDVLALDGTYGICQPQISPLPIKSEDVVPKCLLELVSALAGFEQRDAELVVKATMEKLSQGMLSDRKWKETLHAGYLQGSQAKLSTAEVSKEGSLAASGLDLSEVAQGKVEVVFYPSDAVYDGRLANNGWLQELPQPITKLTWDNAAIVSPATASALGLKQGEMAHIQIKGSGIDLPVFVVPGQADGSVAVQIGYGRTHAGQVGTGKGHSVAELFDPAKGWILTDAEVRSKTVPYALATTQDHFTIDEGGLLEIAKRTPTLVREGTLQQFIEQPKFAPETYKPHHASESLWREPIDRIEQEMPFLPQWGMTIDLNKCTGCNACVIACQAENNVPVVGKDQVRRGREMHWLRIDRYFQCDFDKTYNEGKFSNPIDVQIVSQPLACVHCETAPCEQVCPVAATVHTEEGINAMAYNRCIGTRYCGNNCPYKVRRFNYYNLNKAYGYFYGWQDKREEANRKLQQLVLNPEVTVRGRGVMEKCTYCIQRVQNGKIAARQTGDGKIHDGDIKTACQEACPTQAIVFGDLTDKQSRVYRYQNDPRSYAMLEELNVKPRTLYLARLRNVPKSLMTNTQLHPKEIEAHGDHGHGDHSEDKHSEQKHS